MGHRSLELVCISPLKAGGERLAGNDQAAEARTVADVMRRDLVAVVLETPLHQAARVLLHQRSPGLPVVDSERRVVGVLTELDLMARLGPRRRRPWWRVFVDSDAEAEEYQQAVGTVVGDVMRGPTITARPTLTLHSALRLFDAPRLSLIPVVDDGRLIGTLSRQDLVKGLLIEPPVDTSASDADLAARMCERLQQESWIPSPPPSVLARHGILGLWGVVPSEAQKAALEAMARTIPGCTGVENRLISTESMSRNDKTV